MACRWWGAGLRTAGAAATEGGEVFDRGTGEKRRRRSKEGLG